MTMKPVLKISGIRDLQDARYCAAVGISLIGFNMGRYKERQVQAESVKEILSWLSGPVAVGEFAYETADEIARAAATSGIRYLSLPIDYAIGELAGLALPLILRVETENEMMIAGRAESFPPGTLFEVPAEFLGTFQVQWLASRMPQFLVLAPQPEAVWSLLSGLQPHGFSLGHFAEEPGGSINYEACDEFLAQYSERQALG